MELWRPYLISALGGVLIGISAAILLLFNGRIAGVSGIMGRLLFFKKSDRAWRAAFLAGLLSGGFIFSRFDPSYFEFSPAYSFSRMAWAGFLVGLGSHLAGGCTSGHGVCGISRLSLRSVVATLIFMASGFATVYLFNTLGGRP